MAITFLQPESPDAQVTREYVDAYGRTCLLLRGDISKERHCQSVVNRTIKAFGRLDILVNNAGLHYKQKSIENITAAQLKRTFEVNVFAIFYLVKAALRFMREGSSIINTTSVTAYRGSPALIDYSASKGRHCFIHA